jgi:hypothetical protein
MASTSTGLEVVPDEKDLVLRVKAGDGTLNEIRLTEAQALALVQSAPRIQQWILQRHRPKGDGFVPVLVTRVVELQLADDSFGESLLLTPIAANGARGTFALPRQLVKLLIDRLPARLARLESPRPARQ